MASQAAKDAIFVPSQPFEGVRIQGPDFNIPIELNELLKSYETIGFQATGLARAIELINKMVSYTTHPSWDDLSRIADFLIISLIVVFFSLDFIFFSICSIEKLEIIR